MNTATHAKLSESYKNGQASVIPLYLPTYPSQDSEWK